MTITIAIIPQKIVTVSLGYGTCTTLP